VLFRSVIEHLQARSNLDADDISVIVRDGCVTLEGRVGTDDEVQVAGEVLDDLLGLENISNNLIVDPLRRGETPFAASEPALEPVIGADVASVAVDEAMIAAEDIAVAVITPDDLAAEEAAITEEAAIAEEEVQSATNGSPADGSGVVARTTDIAADAADAAISAVKEPLIAPDDTATVQGEMAAVVTETEDSPGDLELLQQSDTAEHLATDSDDEVGSTHDPIRAIRDAEPYSPPEGPVGDGYGSREDH
jgi:hypothetical protein